MRTLVTDYFALIRVDDGDYDFFNRWQWTYSPGHYARRKENGINYYLHIEILKRAGLYEEGKQVDHKNRDRTDCQRSNLRMATVSQNRRNRLQENNHSRFRGVRPSGAGYAAYTCEDGKQVHLGTFPTEIEAAKAYNDYVGRLYGDFAVLNSFEEINHG